MTQHHTSSGHREGHPLLALSLACLAWASTLGPAQAEVRDLALAKPAPADVVEVAPVQGTPVQVDLGEQLPNAPGAAGASTATPGASIGAATRAAAAAMTKRTSAKAAGNAGGGASATTERVVFARLPVRVGLSVGQERLVTLPGPVALHVPADIDTVARIESIDRTLYVTALVPFTPLRIVAELIDGGQQIPLDLVAKAGPAQGLTELEVFLPAGRGGKGSGQAVASGAGRDDAAATEEPAVPAANMVELTRFASRMLYAPRRLAQGMTGVQQVALSAKDAPGLVPGARVQATPMAQWRSGDLYVTAVRVTNRSATPLELPLENLRGRWVAVTAQHGRIGAAGTETDTTALYLICDRAFEACL
jgi:integrating conjugative element protein (TIGR03749 family)